MCELCTHMYSAHVCRLQYVESGRDQCMRIMTVEHVRACMTAMQHAWARVKVTQLTRIQKSHAYLKNTYSVIAEALITIKDASALANSSQFIQYYLKYKMRQ